MTNGFQRRKVDITLFCNNYDSHFIIVQIYKEFEMRMMGELKFFLGLQIKQVEDVKPNMSRSYSRNPILKIVKQCQLQCTQR
ncbi:hypothetical protein CR513_31011, partial [Mucuna pruriens]